MEESFVRSGAGLVMTMIITITARLACLNAHIGIKKKKKGGNEQFQSLHCKNELKRQNKSKTPQRATCKGKSTINTR